jgi:hypothetical protein
MYLSGISSIETLLSVGCGTSWMLYFEGNINDIDFEVLITGLVIGIFSEEITGDVIEIFDSDKFAPEIYLNRILNIEPEKFSTFAEISLS